MKLGIFSTRFWRPRFNNGQRAPVPGELVGQTLSARADPTSVKLHGPGGQLVKVHSRVAPGRRSTDPADLRSERSVYAMRDVNQLIKMAHDHG